MRIGTSTTGSGLNALFNVHKAFQQLDLISSQLATGNRLVSSSVDPSGLVIAEQLNSDIKAIEAAGRNTAYAGYITQTADAALGQASGYLRQMRTAVIQSANSTTTPEQKKALQMQIDAAAQGLDMLSQTTSFAGKKLLDGSSGIEVSGVNSAQIADLKVYQNMGGGQHDLNMEVVQAVSNTNKNIVVKINGQTFTGTGNTVKYSSDTIQADITFQSGYTGAVDKVTVKGSGMQFVLSTDVTQKSTLSLPGIGSSSLGGSAGRVADLTTGGSASLASGDLSKAMDILNTAQDQVVEARAQAGAFQKYAVDSSQALLDAMQINLTKAYSQVHDTDMAQSLSELVRTQILAKTSLKTTGIISKTKGLVLSLLE